MPLPTLIVLPRVLLLRAARAGHSPRPTTQPVPCSPCVRSRFPRLDLLLLVLLHPLLLSFSHHQDCIFELLTSTVLRYAQLCVTDVRRAFRAMEGARCGAEV